ncbi:MAG: class I SAM-dependent methyltransferase [Rhodobacteraceae bacterium]|nr:class I SAM-dependent methyltransferase [Paracoccaceae bacterium]
MGYFTDHMARTGGRAILKMAHYLPVYDRLLRPWQGRDASFLEIGVYQGGSVGMWRGFFGPGARLTFIDIDPGCRAHELPGTEIRIGDQEDEAFLAGVAADRGPFDLIVDDGGHRMSQQIASFRALWPHLADGGLYIVEDTHTSYWPGFGGGYRRPESFIEFAKGLIDRMHSWYTEDEAAFPFDPMAREIGEVRFLDSLVIVAKERKEPPESIVARDGKVTRSRRILTLRNRRSGI